MDRSVSRSSKIVSDRWQFVALLVPKVARTSLKRLLTQDQQDLYEARMEAFTNQKLLRVYGDYFRFGFVRNPWARVASCWRNKIANEGIAKRWQVTAAHGLEPGMPFADFVAWLSTDAGSDEWADRHWASQHLFLYSDGDLLVHHLGKFENLDHDWEQICSKIGVPHHPLPIRNPSSRFLSQEEKQRPEPYWVQLFTNDLISAVGRRYSTDIELFGYPALHLEDNPSWALASMIQPAGR